jgi:hypothetical protein
MGELQMIGSILRWLFGGVIVGLACVFLGLIGWHNLRIRRARRDYRTLPTEVEEQVLQFIQEAAKTRRSLTFLRLDEKKECDDKDIFLQSRVGGVPYAEAGEEWPIGSPAKFLLQVRIDEPSLGEQWVGRLLTVFLVFDVEQIVRSHSAPSLTKHVPMPSPMTPPPCFRLTSVRMPACDQQEEDDQTDRIYPPRPSQLCDMVPSIAEILSPFTKDPPGLLSQILRPNTYSYDLEEWQVAYEGGDPMLIQNPHDPICNECGKPMRFLFQFGEIIPKIELADGGVGYVYGCDLHPHCCKGFIDSH